MCLYWVNYILFLFVSYSCPTDTCNIFTKSSPLLCMSVFSIWHKKWYTGDGKLCRMQTAEHNKNTQSMLKSVATHLLHMRGVSWVNIVYSFDNPGDYFCRPRGLVYYAIRICFSGHRWLEHAWNCLPTRRQQYRSMVWGKILPNLLTNLLTNLPQFQLVLWTNSWQSFAHSHQILVILVVVL